MKFPLSQKPDMARHEGGGTIRWDIEKARDGPDPKMDPLTSIFFLSGNFFRINNEIRIIIPARSLFVVLRLKTTKILPRRKFCEGFDFI